MTRRRPASGFCLAFALFAAAAAQAQPACDRACLTVFTDAYLKALVAHDPKGLPVSAVLGEPEVG